jgi:hypothetical protein
MATYVEVVLVVEPLEAAQVALLLVELQTGEHQEADPLGEVDGEEHSFYESPSPRG